MTISEAREQLKNMARLWAGCPSPTTERTLCDAATAYQDSRLAAAAGILAAERIQTRGAVAACGPRRGILLVALTRRELERLRAELGAQPKEWLRLVEVEEELASRGAQK